MRIVYYTHTCFFETALSLVRELGRLAEVHLLMELTPGSWQTAGFELRPRHLPAGLVPAEPLLQSAFPASVRAFWSTASSFHLVVHSEARSLHPRSWLTSREVIRFAKGLAADVFHVDDVDVTPRLSLALAHSRNLPLVVSTHDPVPHSGERNWRKSLSRRLAFPRARRFVLHNHGQKEAFARLHCIEPARIRVVPLGVYDIFRSWVDEFPAAEPCTILFFGRISPYKGIDVLYRAIPQVLQQVPDARFIVAGRPIGGYQPPEPPRGAPVQVIDRYIPDAELGQLLQRSSLVVCPYRDATQSGVVLTAFAFRKPVVASAVGGLPEYVLDGETGLLVPPGDPDRLAEALVRMLRDEKLRRGMEANIEHAAHSILSWRAVAEALLATYQELR